MATRVENAVAEVIRNAKVATYDVKGRNNNPNSTTEVAEELARKVSATVGA